eukprot:CAMPEP_0172830900 /NCGR_PEP_ID=MMETSP1075-20121228/22567_1 /TAXON_ID=2916 /ORGANISM="Ceratium fusus, Strain PA161109" /LENGTH=329 /DNA_ID=CAMNT_0013673261 /DNA_START=93 /DNA_END=1079 /DNA_ORIENTATION=+
MQGTSRDAMVHAAEEFADLIPPGAQFEVLRSDHAGRFMTAASAEFLPDGSAFLEETPLVAWPLTSELFVSPQTESASKASLYSTNWCENCLCSLQQQQQQQQQQDGFTGIRRVRRRLSSKQSATTNDEVRTQARGFSNLCTGETMYCSTCFERLSTRPQFMTPGLLQRWRSWQAGKSLDSCVGLEALARCCMQVASHAATLREVHGLPAGDALHAALLPFDRLAAPPSGAVVALHGTSPAEVSEQLLGSEPFHSAVVSAIGCQAAAAQLFAESTIAALAGRLVLNAAGIQVLGAGRRGLPLRAAGVYVLLSTMNHSCEPSAEMLFGDSS